jgi:TPR repeat protein
MRQLSRLLCILLLALPGIASSQSEKSPYNQGVIAFRAEDFSTARTQWEIAAAQADPSAWNNLGYLLFSGLGGPIDRARAMTLWRKAAEAGHSESMRFLGAAYEEGTVVPKDLVEAYAWYSCAVASAEITAGEDKEFEAALTRDARNALTRLSAKLSTGALALAEAKAASYVIDYLLPKEPPN